MKPCIDCKAEWERRGEKPPKYLRPARHPGPRCTTHHQQKQRAQKEQRHELYVQKMYNMAPGEYRMLYDFQGGRCYICRRATGASKNLAVDHDHKCCPKPPTCGNCTRGLLCGRCNHDVLGHVQDDPEVLRRAIEYLHSPPYKRMKEGP